MIATLTQEEQDKILEVAQTHSIRVYAMVHTLVQTGLRVSELSGLVIDDVYIAGQIKRVLVLRCEIAKNSTRREIPISSSLQKTLIGYLVWVEKHHKGLDIGWPLFSQLDHNAPLSSRQIERCVRAVGGAALGRRIWPHMLRHTFATNLLRVSNTAIVQQLLGHKNLSSTQVYVHPSADDKAEAIARMALNGKT